MFEVERSKRNGRISCNNKEVIDGVSCESGETAEHKGFSNVITKFFSVET